jgi:hypothetical protein
MCQGGDCTAADPSMEKFKDKSSCTPRSGDPAVEPSRPVLMVEHSSRQQVLPECADRSGDGLPGTITIADVV